ncbi:peptide MFS transporter [Novosphingobium sp. 9]|uniref:peptide MFS transporter n=1 Tax=Novosphingobium sp. 9 TaxID=2025349 RepID=UPI0021B4F757|nr:peptide MFS transporter [Novosphingobium sp. 9]
MTAAEATPDFESEPDFRSSGKSSDTAFLGHPKGLGYLSFVEGCERFSYYSMQTLLVLYMVNYLLLPGHAENVIGLPWLQGRHIGETGQQFASSIFGDYTSLVYFTPILGGLIADRWLGRRATLIAGGVIMSLGHFLMAFESMFLFALIALIVGVGLFKGNIASQVGELYSPKDLRRAMAFQIFYIFINVSVIAAPLIAGTLGQKVGWHWGFGCAGVVMLFGLLIYLKAAPYLPADAREDRKTKGKTAMKLQSEDYPRLIALLILVPVMGIALITNQQIFNAYLVWADQQFQLTFFGHTMPSSWMITLDASLSFLMLLTVAAFWKLCEVITGREPDELGKMIIGSVFTIAGALCLVMAAATQGTGKIGLFWPFMFHFLNSIGFAHILPISLALFTKIAPRPLSGTVVGIYYMSFVLANWIVGNVVGPWLSTMPATTFWLIHAGTGAFGLVAFVVCKLALGRLLSGETPA